ASLRSEGFIHCSAAGQLLGVANSLYSGEQGLVILRIDPELLEVSVIYEDCYDLGEQFPHIYGPLHRAAVTEILSFPPSRDGQFTLPVGLELPT
ncbi:Glutathione S-transferase domain protein, partial [hydrothermal vent metagenome]